MIAAAATRGDVVLKNVIPRHLEIISAKLIEAGVNISEGEDSVRVWVNDDTKFKHINFIAMPYPGFPTDMQPQLVTFLTTIASASLLNINWLSGVKKPKASGTVKKAK